MPRVKKPKRPGPFDKDYCPNGTYSGSSGDPEQWRSAFKARFSPEQIKEILGDDDPWAILGVPHGSDAVTIKNAYRRKAMETHPDRNPTKDDTEFKRVQAAYEQLNGE